MSADPMLTRYRQSSLRSSASESPDCLSSPSIEPEIWSRRPPLTPQPPTLLSVPPRDLWNALLYRDSNFLTTPIALSSTKSHTLELLARTHREHSRTPFGNERGEGSKMSLTSYSRKESLKPEVSERRTKLPKKALAKKKVKNEESSRSRKRSVGKDVGLEERASKMVKTEPKANIGKKVGNGAVALLTAETPHEVIVISDSEDDFDHKSKDHKQDQTMLRSRTRSWKTRREVAPSSTASNTPTCLLLKMEGPDSESDLPPDPVDIIKPNKSRPKELQNALQKLQAAEEANTMLWQEMETEQQQHQSAQDLVKKLQQEMEKRDVDTLLERQKQDTRHEWEVAALHETVQHLRDQLRASQDTVAQRTDERQALQAHYEQERADRKKEQQGHEEILNDTLKSKAAQEDSHAQTAQDEARLSTEVEMLKAAARLNRGFSIPSPVPSQSPSMDEERKEDNVRKSYVRVKRQYDILRAAAKDLSECTRSLDLSSFSEFGRYMERLRAPLEAETDGRPVLKADHGD